MNDWEAYLADTNPHRPAVEPPEDERAGTAAPADEGDPILPSAGSGSLWPSVSVRPATTGGPETSPDLATGIPT